MIEIKNFAENFSTFLGEIDPATTEIHSSGSANNNQKTMSLIILTYDIQKTTNTIHAEVKNALIAMGYSSYVPLQGGGKVGLPNTTLVKDGTTPQQAATDIKNVCRSNSAVLEKYITLVTSYSDGRAEVLR